MSEIYNNSITDRLLACLIQKPEIILETKYKLDKAEFEPNKFHQILYIVIYNLVQSGCKTCSLLDINSFLECYKAQYEVFKNNNGNQYIETITELTDVENFDSYYASFKKLSCLRTYRGLGFDISKYWDFEKTDGDNLENINNYNIEDIINNFDAMQVKVVKDYYPKQRDMEETKAGDGLVELKALLEQEPMYGSSFPSELMNSITRGLMNGQLTCISAPTGVGKTTVAVGMMCKICATKLWDDNIKKFVDNPCRTKNGGLYCQFELDNETELSLKFLAYISGVSCAKILDGVYSEEESKRVDEAIGILKESNIHLAYMPNFTKRLIEETIKDKVLNYGVDFVVWDYIQECAALNGEMNRENGGVGLRPDQVLANLSDFLKLMARTYNVPLLTSTQTNANLGTMESIGSESIAGSRAVANKLDIGGVFLPIRPRERKVMEELEQEIGNRGFNLPHPTHIIHFYKVRFGSYPQNCKLWINVDLGTGRVKDCFVTTWNNELIKVPKTKLERKDDED